MECCVGVSTETIFQMFKFYIVVKRIFNLTFWTVVLRLGEWQRTTVRNVSLKILFALRCRSYPFAKLFILCPIYRVLFRLTMQLRVLARLVCFVGKYFMYSQMLTELLKLKITTYKSTQNISIIWTIRLSFKISCWSHKHLFYTLCHVLSIGKTKKRNDIEHSMKANKQV